MKKINLHFSMCSPNKCFKVVFCPQTFLTFQHCDDTGSLTCSMNQNEMTNKAVRNRPRTRTGKGINQNKLMMTSWHLETNFLCWFTQIVCVLGKAKDVTGRPVSTCCDCQLIATALTFQFSCFCFLAIFHVAISIFSIFLLLSLLSLQLLSLFSC